MKHSIQSRLCPLLMVLLLVLSSVATASADDLVDVVLSAGTTQAFTGDKVSQEDLSTILQAGLRATSSMNKQPWYFAAVTNQEVMREIADSMSMGGMPIGAAPGMKAPAGEKPSSGANAPAATDSTPIAPPAASSSSAKAALGDSPVAIIIYMNEASGSTNASFDCGLACQNMFIVANTLGYGAKIVSSPTIALNGEKHDVFCEKLGVSTSMNAIAVLLIGIPDETVDGVTGATTRSALDESVSFVP